MQGVTAAAPFACALCGGLAALAVLPGAWEKVGADSGALLYMLNVTRVVSAGVSWWPVCGCGMHAQSMRYAPMPAPVSAPQLPGKISRGSVVAAAAAVSHFR